jgi:hypothetical protein
MGRSAPGFIQDSMIAFASASVFQAVVICPASSSSCQTIS